MDDVCNLTMDIEAKGTLVLYDETEQYASVLLKSLVDIESVAEGGVFLDDLPHDEYYRKNSITETFGYVFNEGIMLSNLSLRENLLLPFKLRFPDKDKKDFELRVAELMQLFELEIDLELRPAFVQKSILKQVCFVRSLLLEPRVLLVDDPYYLLNRFDREKMLKVLSRIKTMLPMILCSTDTDFMPPFSDRFMVWNNINHKFEDSIAIT